MSRLYVYAFSESPLEPFALSGRRIRTVEIEGIHVAVDGRVPRNEASEDSLRRQHAIVEAIAARSGAVLPARAGSLVETAELRARIGRSKPLLQSALDMVRGREQMTLRLSGAAPVAAFGGVRALSGTAYLEARRAATAPSAELLGVVHALVSDLIHAERVQPARGALPAAVFHLITRGDAAEYRQRIDGAIALAAARPQVTGPWPPFAFTPELAG
jgi:hypothetical protein